MDVERLPAHVLVEHEYVRAGTEAAEHQPPSIHEVFSFNRADNRQDTMGKGNIQTGEILSGEMIIKCCLQMPPAVL